LAVEKFIKLCPECGSKNLGQATAYWKQLVPGQFYACRDCGAEFPCFEGDSATAHNLAGKQERNSPSVRGKDDGK
jgi:DNA-directed RNA polymerase subunit RPC12/RpoP